MWQDFETEKFSKIISPDDDDDDDDDDDEKFSNFYFPPDDDESCGGTDKYTPRGLTPRKLQQKQSSSSYYDAAIVSRVSEAVLVLPPFDKGLKVNSAKCQDFDL